MIQSKHRSIRHYAILFHFAKMEFDEVDDFLDFVNESQQRKRRILEKYAASQGIQELDDSIGGDFAQLDALLDYATEFAILGLWRCVELYRKRAIATALGKDAAKEVFKNKKWVKQLEGLGIIENRIRCARSVDELRCLNNAIKHQRYVSNELRGFKQWKKKNREPFRDLGPHYKRLRPLAWRYLEDLTKRFNRWWKKRRKSN